MKKETNKSRKGETKSHDNESHTEHDMYRLLDYKEKMSDKGGKLFWNFRTSGIFLLF